MPLSRLGTELIGLSWARQTVAMEPAVPLVRASFVPSHLTCQVTRRQTCSSLTCSSLYSSWDIIIDASFAVSGPVRYQNGYHLNGCFIRQQIRPRQKVRSGGSRGWTLDLPRTEVGRHHYGTFGLLCEIIPL